MAYFERTTYSSYQFLPAWAKLTLEKHRSDLRMRRYPFDQRGLASTLDRVWNAAQAQLMSEGRMHNYLRTLWGKKVLEWTAEPQEAAAILIELNNRFAVDGRNPNSYSGIL